ncbi:ribonuclease P protein component [bacterium]|jgi:ribonuclease P protein component|nr:ribonuclease P protein component [bacterium]MBT3849799.1 ribonuclease P protein component [bacterium]MBT4634410.1 ribonuclease P protein component [bacterium]
MNSSSTSSDSDNLDFKKLLKIGRKFRIKGIDIFFNENKNIKRFKLGVIVSKKVSNLAVVRNRQRRLIKEIVRLDFTDLYNKEFLFLAKKDILDLDFNRIRKELSIFRKHITDEKTNTKITTNSD